MDVLQPARRRRRRTRRRLVWPRLLPLIAIVLAALVLGLVVGARHSDTTPGKATHSQQPTLVAQRAREVTTHTTALLHGPAAITAPISVTAPAAIVVDAGTGQVLWMKRGHQRRQIASTTKIMTALLALRALRPNDVVTIDRSVTRVPLIREGLRAGEQVEVWKLLHGLLMYSGNDDALALAIGAAGSRPAFIHAMNNETVSLGLHDTHFRSPSGVEDDDNYSSAWDLAALTRVAMRNPRFRAVVRTRRIEVPWAPPTNAKIYINKNLMLTRYPGADGVKTGYTARAGHCLVASATRHGVSLIAVVLDSRDMYADATRLLDAGFAAG